MLSSPWQHEQQRRSNVSVCLEEPQISQNIDWILFQHLTIVQTPVMTCTFSPQIHLNVILFIDIKGETSALELCELIKKKLIGAGVQNGGSQVILMLRHTWAGLTSTGELERTHKFQLELSYLAAKPTKPPLLETSQTAKKLDEKHEIITNICSRTTEKEDQTGKRK